MIRKAINRAVTDIFAAPIAVINAAESGLRQLQGPVIFYAPAEVEFKLVRIGLDDRPTFFMGHAMEHELAVDISRGREAWVLVNNERWFKVSTDMRHARSGVFYGTEWE